MTLEKVARLANVSVSTASKALKNSFDVSKETRQRVLDAAHKCGYFAQKKKISSDNRKTSELCIAVICPEVISPHYSSIVETVTELCDSLGYTTVIYNAGFEEDKYKKILSSCTQNTKIDAIINLSSYGRDISAGFVPHILLSDEDAANYSCIDSKTDLAFQLIKDTMPDWKRVAFASEGLTYHKDELFKSVFPSAEIIVGEGRFEQAGESVAKQLLRAAELPDAVVCAYDEIAYGLISTLEKNGLSVPKDIEVVGINDIPTSSWVFGGLSSVSFNYEVLFEEILSDITNDIKNKSVVPRKYSALPIFIKRATTK